MSKRAPSTTQLLVIAGFALSCFGILLFLWVTFGGPTPFRAKPYQVKVPFNEATQLAEQSDVRISGVNVGKVQSIDLAPNGNQALATVDIDAQYAPLPDLDPGDPAHQDAARRDLHRTHPGFDGTGPELADGGSLPTANIAESVQLDEIFRTFDPETRAAFQSWMQEAAIAINGQGQNLSYAIGQFEPTFTEFDKLFRILDTQRLAVGQLFRNGATTFRALRGREGQLAELIQQLQRRLPDRGAARPRHRSAVPRLPDLPRRVEADAEPAQRLSRSTPTRCCKQLVPAAEELSPTLIAIGKLAPEAKGFFEGLKPVIAEAPTGFPAFRKIFRDEFPPLLRAVDPFLRNLNPILTGLKLYKNEVTSFFGNIAATFNARLTVENEKGEKQHYLRLMGPLNAETLSTYPNRLGINRNSAYSPPLWARGLSSGGLPGFDTRQCTSGITVTPDPETAKSPGFRERTKKGTVEEAEVLFNNLKKYAFGGQTGTAATTPPICTQQPPFEPIYGTGPATAYQRTFEQPPR